MERRSSLGLRAREDLSLPTLRTPVSGLVTPSLLLISARNVMPLSLGSSFPTRLILVGRPQESGSQYWPGQRTKENNVAVFSLSLTSLVAKMVKNLSAIPETWGSIPGSGRSPGKGNGNPLVFLPGECHGWRSLAGYSPRGHKESDTSERLTLYIRKTGEAGRPLTVQPNL